ncbi:MAG: carcinine hydrolase/isopenicillin-N N-acyltransferase family protein [Lachnospiraceae bacterium]|nr:carcinine hydrolase/isopenicillin-N N-acyltransferase family protein [Lachnospiraceae bacterium]
MKKRYLSLLLAGVCVAGALSGCGAKTEAPATEEVKAEAEDTAAEDDADAPEESVEEALDVSTGEDTMAASDTHSDFVRVTDYVFEVTFDNYEQYFEDSRAFMSEKYKIGACSSVQNDMIRGRNYDWYYDDSVCFVAHVPATEDRHASVGVVTGAGLTAEQVLSGEEHDIYKILPYGTLDGINDEGLCININVVNFGEKGEFVMRTEDTSDDVAPLAVPRLLLDKAGNIEEAVAMLKEMDIYSLGKGNEAHYMLSGKTSATDDTYKCVVIELIPDENKHYQISVVDKFVGDMPIMTNFHLTGYDGTMESLTEHPMGLERYEILVKNYGMSDTIPGMQDLMKKVYFTRNYDLYSDNWWYSDMAKSANLTMADRGAACLNGDPANAGAYEAQIRTEMADYLNRSRSDKDKSWHTVHTSVFDCEKNELYMTSQEGAIVYHFGLDSRID